MNVYILSGDVNQFQSLQVVDLNNFDWMYHFDGRSSQLSSWKLYKVKKYYGEKQDNILPASDFPSFSGHIPVFSRKAALALDEILHNHGEILPFSRQIVGEEYYAYNVTRILDILDEDKSTVARYSDGSVLNIHKFVFKFTQTEIYPIFKLPQLPFLYVFVTETFKKKVEESMLTGFKFTPVGNVANE